MMQEVRYSVLQYDFANSTAGSVTAKLGCGDHKFLNKPYYVVEALSDVF